MNKSILSLVFFVIFSYCSTAQEQDSQTLSAVIATADSIQSKVLNENRRIWIHLPNNGQLNPNEKYPVIYLLDGTSLMKSLQTVYDNYWGHYLPQMILVGISNQNNRTRDLTTSKVTMRYGAPFEQETGGAENFSQFIITELIPYIEETYPVSSHRTLIGHSNGGLFTINMLMNHREWFSNYIAIDPSLDWDNQQLLKASVERLKTEDFSGKSLFICLAGEQLNMADESVTIDNLMEDTSEFSLFARSIVAFNEASQAATKNGLRSNWQYYEEDLHGTVPLPAMRDGLVSLFDWFQFKHPQKYNNPETSLEEIKSLLEKQQAILTENFGYETPPMVEELLTGYGYMFLQTGQPEKSELFFKLGVKHYPNSANVYDSLADYYVSKNDKENALKNVKLAYEISKSDYHKKRIEDLQNN